MKIQNIHTHIKIGLVVLLLAFLNPIDLQAQRFSRGGGGASRGGASTHRSTPSRSSSMSRAKSTSTRQKSSINGGFNKSSSRNLP